MRLFGCRRPLVAPHLHRVSFRLHAASRMPALPASNDQRETGLVAPVKDQGGTSSCEGHACSGATETALALAGDALDFVPSELGLYRGGRAVERARRAPLGALLPLLEDAGAFTEDVIAWMAAEGVRARVVGATSDGRNSDCEEATVNAEETELGAQVQTVLVGPYAIDPGAADVEQLVKASLSADIPVRVDAFVDSAFAAWTPRKPPVPAPDERDPDGGGHAIYIVGYVAGGYIVRNSWGTREGDGGDYLVSSTWLRAAWGLYPWTVRRAA